MTIDDQIRDEKLQYDINREVAKISALSSRTIVYSDSNKNYPKDFINYRKPEKLFEDLGDGI